MVAWHSSSFSSTLFTSSSLIFVQGRRGRRLLVFIMAAPEPLAKSHQLRWDPVEISLLLLLLLLRLLVLQLLAVLRWLNRFSRAALRAWPGEAQPRTRRAAAFFFVWKSNENDEITTTTATTTTGGSRNKSGKRHFIAFNSFPRLTEANRKYKTGSCSAAGDNFVLIYWSHRPRSLFHSTESDVWLLTLERCDSAVIDSASSRKARSSVS